MNDMVNTVLENLRKNRMLADYVPTKEEVVPLVRSLIPLVALWLPAAPLR